MKKHVPANLGGGGGGGRPKPSTYSYGRWRNSQVLEADQTLNEISRI